MHFPAMPLQLSLHIIIRPVSMILSQADISITRKLKHALALSDIQTLDHVLVGSTVSSMAELGLL